MKLCIFELKYHCHTFLSNITEDSDNITGEKSLGSTLRGPGSTPHSASSLLFRNKFFHQFNGSEDLGPTNLRETSQVLEV